MCKKNPKIITKKLLALLSEFSKIEEYTVSMQKPIDPRNYNEQSENEIKTTPFIIASKWAKLENWKKLTQGVKNLSSENYKTLKEIKIKIKEKISYSWFEELNIVSMAIPPNSIYRLSTLLSEFHLASL